MFLQLATRRRLHEVSILSFYSAQHARESQSALVCRRARSILTVSLTVDLFPFQVRDMCGFLLLKIIRILFTVRVSSFISRWITMFGVFFARLRNFIQVI